MPLTRKRVEEPMKPGWQTTEFWKALITQATNLAALGGLITTQDQALLQNSLTASVTAVFVVLSNAAIVIKYIQSRHDLKMRGSNGNGK
jgi:hypothetical protein